MKVYGKRAGSRLIAVAAALCMLFSVFHTDRCIASAASQNEAAIQAEAVKQTEPALIISGKGASKGDGFQGNYKYLTQAQLGDITSEAAADRYFSSEKRDTYINDAVYSARTKAEKGGWGQFSISGIDLAAAADSLGIDPGKNMTVYTQAKDGYTGRAINILTEQRYAFSSQQANTGSPVFPVIALKWNKLTSDFPSLEAPHFVFGQLDTEEYNMQSWIKGLKFIWLGDKETALSLNINGQSKAFTLAEIIGTKSGSYTSEYQYTEGGQQAAVTAQGVPLDGFLRDAGVQGNADIKTNSGKTIADPSDYFLAYDAKLSDGSTVKTTGQLILYGPGQTKEEAVTENLTSLQITLSSPGQTKGLKAAAVNYNSIKLTWSKVSGAEGYNIYRSSDGGKSYQLHDCAEGAAKTTYTDKNLNTGTTYQYRIKAYRTIAGKDLEGAFSSSASAKPVLSQSSIKKLSKSGSSAIRAAWSKVSGASGYQLRIGENSAVTKKVKTFKTGSSTTTKTITKLKKGTKYYVKVRPYRSVSGKTIYGPYSKVKSIKR